MNSSTVAARPCRSSRRSKGRGELEAPVDIPGNAAACRQRPASAGTADPIPWTDHAVGRLHVAVLRHALAVLRSRGNASEKREILRWIWAPAVFCWVTRTRAGVATLIPIYRRQLPFMFETCCAFDGQQPEVLRELLEHVLRPLLKEVALESPVGRETGS
jgi:hypothetical protein